MLKEFGALSVELDRLPVKKGERARQIISDTLLVGMRVSDFEQLKKYETWLRKHDAEKEPKKKRQKKSRG